ncbi:MAG: glycosyltransferase [Cyclobacteriaceae bacterium]|nr:glycosyltransferase [Cyclobacteriaceae bacterium]
MDVFITIVYSLALLYIFLFSLGQLDLTWTYLKNRNKKQLPKADLTAFPVVTVQLPLYNEKYVAGRLLDAVSQFDYPKERLEIQVLDDSTDETTSILIKKIEELRPLGLDIKLIHRENRTDYKAGALDHGFHSAKGEFTAIFDADFIPSPDFLKKTLPYFANETTGVVQTRWGHLNRDYSILTQWQAFGLDAHFSIEQSARNASGSFINFNGTCGIWRKKCIADAGGWNFDTLTEDLDLSYRAQLKGWKFIYLEDVATPGELPVIMPAIKSQQYRWNKGGAETARKMFGNVWRSPLPLKNKLHAFFHLFNSSVFVCLLTAAVLSVPMLYIKVRHPEVSSLFHVGIIFLLGFFSIALFYWVATKRFYASPGFTFFRLFPGFLMISMGLSLHNGLAVVEGLFGRKTPFIRTPKFNVTNRKETWRGNSYIRTRIGWMTWLEALMCLYFVFGTAAGFYLHEPGLVFFHVMLALGFGAVVYYSVKPVFHG